MIRKGVALVLPARIDAEATEVIGAEHYARAEGRSNWRNGNRERLLATKAGDVELKVPKLRRGSSSHRFSSGADGSIGPCSRW